MALPRTPITIQVSPSTYLLMLKLTDLSVEYVPGTDNLRFKTGVQTVLDTLYTELIGLPANAGTTTTIADLKKLQTDGLTEAQEINRRAGSEVAMTC